MVMTITVRLPSLRMYRDKIRKAQNVKQINNNQLPLKINLALTSAANGLKHYFKKEILNTQMYTIGELKLAGIRI